MNTNFYAVFLSIFDPFPARGVPFFNQTDDWCKKNMNPDNSSFLKNVNMEAMKQVFTWVKGHAPSLRSMKRLNYLLILLDMFERQHHRENISR